MKHARADYDRIQDPAGLIPEDEPVILIRGQDQAAVPTANAWVAAHMAGGGDPQLAILIREQIGRIEEWQRTQNFKVADLPASTDG